MGWFDDLKQRWLRGGPSEPAALHDEATEDILTTPEAAAQIDLLPSSGRDDSLNGRSSPRPDETAR